MLKEDYGEKVFMSSKVVSIVSTEILMVEESLLRAVVAEELMFHLVHCVQSFTRRVGSIRTEPHEPFFIGFQALHSIHKPVTFFKAGFLPAFFRTGQMNSVNLSWVGSISIRSQQADSPQRVRC